uniref:Uncharacterized protein n=1 Tax=Molossus molossus TaxID=27622 RepID=A0A7J8FSF1_MOLMO|nr:hypothetical protein HJG59_008339 [Molossus molossus]
MDSVQYRPCGLLVQSYRMSVSCSNPTAVSLRLCDFTGRKYQKSGAEAFVNCARSIPHSSTSCQWVPTATLPLHTRVWKGSRLECLHCAGVRLIERESESRGNALLSRVVLFTAMATALLSVSRC